MCFKETQQFPHEPALGDKGEETLAPFHTARLRRVCRTFVAPHISLEMLQRWSECNETAAELLTAQG